MATVTTLPPRRWPSFTLLILVSACGMIALGISIGSRGTFDTAHSLWSWAFVTFFFGALVGFSEILSRYRDEPMLATATTAGMSYLTFNGTISVLAFAVLRTYPEKILPGLSHDLFLSSVAAGFGAMIIFRSKLFTFKSSDGNEYPIGPAIVLDTILKMIDSKIDRRRATDRQTRVFNAMIGIQDFPKIADYIEASLPSFQNLSEDDKKQINVTITQYRASKLPDTLKSLGLGFAFLTIAGEDIFDHVISNIKQYVLSQSTVPTPPAATTVPASSNPPRI